jgi:hypothetical protein
LREDGRQIDESDEPARAPAPSSDSREPVSRLNVESDEQPEKQRPPSRSTDDGMQIEASAEQYQNTTRSIQESLEPASKTTVESDRHFSKHPSQILFTEAGMQIDESDKHSSNA